MTSIQTSLAASATVQILDGFVGFFHLALVGGSLELSFDGGTFFRHSAEPWATQAGIEVRAPLSVWIRNPGGSAADYRLVYWN